MIGSYNKTTDIERVNVILEYFKRDIRKHYNNYKTNYATLFSKYTKEFHVQGISQRNISNWLSWKIDRINQTSRDTLNDVFNIAPWIWTETFHNGMREMIKRMPEFIDINPKEDIDDLVYIDELSGELHEDEQKIIDDYKGKEKIDINSINLSKYSPIFLHRLAKKLKSKQQIKDALKVIKHIFLLDSNYKYAYYSELELLEAVCYSHDSIKDWGKAINILRRLYGIGYHHKNLEVATLLASNYKRKALTNKQKEWCKTDEIDEKLLSYALNIYKKTMKMRKKSEKYYDAINLYYLIKIFTKINKDYNDASTKETLEELDTIYHQTKFDITNWWETASKAEFLILQGLANEAIATFNYHMELDKNEAFNMDTTIRQLALYVHFTDDSKAIKVLNYLNEVKKDIKFI